ncbi:MAG: hypothetical protein HYV03_03800 [Deltaproteobacteria bacterium]|nr:hypothetical protein [Deltaproteobacteria bacterium]
MKASPSLGALFCYVGIPITGLLVSCCAKRPELKFHARQSVCLGLCYIGVLCGLSFLDAVGGAFFRWAGAVVAAVAPVVGLFGILIWGVVVVQLLRGRQARIPVIGRWAERSVR